MTMIRRRRYSKPTDRDLVSLADGSLPAKRRARVEREVSESTELQARVAAQRRALRAISRAADQPTPAALHARLSLAAKPTRTRPRTSRHALATLAPGAALAAAAIVAVLVVVGSGASGGPTVADAAALAIRAPVSPAPATHRESAVLPRLHAAGLPFPYWGGRFGFEATGFRRDRLDGRLATTVFYSRAGQRVAYAIVSGQPLPSGHSSHSTTRNGIRLQSFTAHGRVIVTWLRRGHTCVLSGAGVAVRSLLRLAAWRGGGAIPY
jgi:hypothetical protein